MQSFLLPKMWRIGCALKKMVVTPQSQARDLETVFSARHNGRGPDSSFKRILIFVWIRVC